MLSSDRKFEFKEVPTIRTSGQKRVASVDPMDGILTAEQEELMPGGHKDIPLKNDVVVEFEGSQFPAQRTSSPDPSVDSYESTFEFDFEGTRYQVVQDEEGDCVVMDGIEMIGPCTVKTGSIRKTARDFKVGDKIIYNGKNGEIFQIDLDDYMVKVEFEDGDMKEYDLVAFDQKARFASKKVQATAINEQLVGLTITDSETGTSFRVTEVNKAEGYVSGSTDGDTVDYDYKQVEEGLNSGTLKVTGSKKLTAMKVSIDCEDMEETRSELKEMFPEGSVKRDGDSGLTISVPYDDEAELKKWLKKNGYEEGMGMETLGQKKVASDEYDFTEGDEFLLDGKKVKIKYMYEGNEWMGTEHDKAGEEVDVVGFTNDPSNTAYTFQQLENMIADGELVRIGSTKKTAGYKNKGFYIDDDSLMFELSNSLEIEVPSAAIKFGPGNTITVNYDSNDEGKLIEWAKNHASALDQSDLDGFIDDTVDNRD